MQAVVLASDNEAINRISTPSLPAALAQAGSRRIIDHTVDLLASDRRVDTIHVCTNQGGYGYFIDWLKLSGRTGTVEVFMNSGARVKGPGGRISDLSQLCIKKGLKDQLLVVPGDKVLDFDLGQFLDYCMVQDGDVIVATSGDTSADPDDGCGVAMVTSQQRVISFGAESSERGKGLFAHPVVFLSSQTLPFLGRYISEGNDPDSIGSLMRWSYRKRPLFTYLAEGNLYRVSSVKREIRKSSSGFEKKGKK